MDIRVGGSKWLWWRHVVDIISLWCRPMCTGTCNCSEAWVEVREIWTGLFSEGTSILLVNLSCSVIHPDKCWSFILVFRDRLIFDSGCVLPTIKDGHKALLLQRVYCGISAFTKWWEVATIYPETLSLSYGSSVHCVLLWYLLPACLSQSIISTKLFRPVTNILHSMRAI